MSGRHRMESTRSLRRTRMLPCNEPRSQCCVIDHRSVAERKRVPSRLFSSGPDASLGTHDHRCRKTLKEKREGVLHLVRPFRFERQQDVVFGPVEDGI